MRIVQFFKRPFRWAAVFSALLTGFFAFALLDTFVIPKAMVVVDDRDYTAELTESLPLASSEPDAGQQSTAQQSEPVIDGLSYSDENIRISIETVREYGTTFYVADIQLSDASCLKTAFAQSTYGRNIKETTSGMAADNNAIFAINGDYYGFRDKGYVLRNGVLYRDTSNHAQALVVDGEGNFSIVQETETSARSLLDGGALQVFSFGPVLVNDGEIVVDASSEVSQSMRSNPRTAIGQISELHYIFIVSDGRTKESSGFSLFELAEQFEKRGCTIAYNLDGGGSSVMVFNGSVINNPTDGRNGREREVSDIVYIGYE